MKLYVHMMRHNPAAIDGVLQFDEPLQIRMRRTTVYCLRVEYNLGGSLRPTDDTKIEVERIVICDANTESLYSRGR